MGVRSAHVLQPRTRNAEQGMVDGHDRLAHDPEQARVGQELVRLVHGAGLRVLEGDDAEGGLSARHPRERMAHGVAREGFGIGEEGPHGALAVRPGLSLVGDLHGAEGEMVSRRTEPRLTR